jgi:hypothetical protein
MSTSSTKFYSAYVHEFEDKSVLLVVTEHTKRAQEYRGLQRIHLGAKS